MIAKDIKAGDNIQATEGFVEVLSVDKEELKDKTKVYNFNVLGYHTYVVGDDLIVVHNSCKKTDTEFDSMDDAVKYADDVLGTNSTVVNKME